MVVGTFFHEDYTVVEIEGGPPVGIPYYYMDDIRLSTDSTFAWEGLSIPEPTTHQILVYPNPSSESIRIDWPTSDLLRVSLFDMLGKQVSQALINPNEPMDVSALPEGCYQMLISDGENNVTERIVKLDH